MVGLLYVSNGITNVFPQDLTTQWVLFLSLTMMRHERHGVSYHRHLDCMFKSLFKLQTNKTSKPQVAMGLNVSVVHSCENCLYSLLPLCAFHFRWNLRAPNTVFTAKMNCFWLSKLLARNDVYFRALLSTNATMKPAIVLFIWVISHRHKRRVYQEGNSAGYFLQFNCWL